MSTVIRLANVAGIHLVGDNQPPKGAYLASYDPEFMRGRGEATWTLDPRQAMRFASSAAALKCWQTTSKLRPLRPDGKPNRPLTAYTVSIEEATP